LESLQYADTNRHRTTLPVKHPGMALPDPTKSAKSNNEASVLLNSHLLAALRGSEVFRYIEHVAVIKAVRSELTSRKKKTNDLA
jgi:cytidylate kinase